MREISKTDKKIVTDFIKENKNHFSKESLENSIKYFDKEEKKRMRELLSQLTLKNLYNITMKILPFEGIV